jgi:hypothetical protein
MGNIVVGGRCAKSEAKTNEGMSGEVAPPRELANVVVPGRVDMGRGLREKSHRQRGCYGGGSQTGTELVLGRR